MYVCIYIYIYIYTHVYCTYIYMYIHTCIYQIHTHNHETSRKIEKLADMVVTTCISSSRNVAIDHDRLVS